MSINIIDQHQEQNLQQAIFSYFDNMTPIDRSVRANTSPTEFINNMRDPSTDETRVLNQLTSDKRLATLFPSIPWKFKFFDPQFENGFPHTHLDYIFLPYDFFKSKSAETVKEILVHEKVHVWQRMYPFQCHKLLIDKMGYQVCCIDKSKLRRSNPDINKLAYIDPSGNVISSDYKSDKPVSITDMKDSRDHPFEMMAYKIASDVMKL